MSCISKRQSSQHGLSRLSTRSGSHGTLQASKATPSEISQKPPGLPPVAESGVRLTAAVLSRLDRGGLKPPDTASARLAAAMSSQASQRVVSLPPLRPEASKPTRQTASAGRVPRDSRGPPRAEPGAEKAAPRRAPARDAAREAVSQEPLRSQRRPPKPKLGNRQVQSLDWASEEAWKASEARWLGRRNSNRADEKRGGCPHCGRRFWEDALARHARVCVNVFRKQRKAFNATRQRMPPEALQLRLRKAAEVRIPSTWRQRSRALRRAIRSARAVSAAKGRPLRGADATPTDGRVSCPHCGRKFEEAMAGKHIPVCRRSQPEPEASPKSHGQRVAGVSQRVAGRDARDTRPW
ncbi:unnamed protein product [Effrenium voratum]|nr:unnamed protein product [Effrenium voratum]